jgi:hypothetical protein
MITKENTVLRPNKILYQVFKFLNLYNSKIFELLSVIFQHIYAILFFIFYYIEKKSKES